MLRALRTPALLDADAELFATLRAHEFGALDEQDLCYLDYTGAAIPARTQLDAQAALLRTYTLGNPHSEHIASRRSTDAIEAARRVVLQFVEADGSEYAVIFTANTSAAIKLVAEGFPFTGDSTLVLSADNHNSMNGIREYARRAGAPVRTVPLTAELRLRNVSDVLSLARGAGARLFGFPAQSNFSGVQHSLSLVAEAQRLGYTVLLDAAAYLPSNLLSLRRIKPEFVALSMYKLFGFPTGVGALIARRDALARLNRPWFAGGTVDWVSVRHRVHRLKAGVEGFEDGTPNFAGIAALPAGFALLSQVGMSRLTTHVHSLAEFLLRQLRSRRHANGASVFLVYGPRDLRDRGGTVSFNVLNDSGGIVHYEQVELHASRHGVAVRGGCFCNPGASEAAFGFPADPVLRCLETTADESFSPRKLADCLGGGVAVGAIRMSVGLANTFDDITRGVDVVASIVSA